MAPKINSYANPIINKNKNKNIITTPKIFKDHHPTTHENTYIISKSNTINKMPTK